MLRSLAPAVLFATLLGPAVPGLAATVGTTVAGAPPSAISSPTAAPVPMPVPVKIPTQPEGVLLGVQSDKGVETYFADATGISRVGAGVAVARRDGFWKVDVDAGRLVVGPGPKLHPLPPAERHECGPSYVLRLRSVRPELISYQWTQTDGGCKEVPTKTESSWAGTAWLDESLNGSSDLSDEQLLAIDQVLGPVAKALVDQASGDPNPYEGKRTNWILSRRNAYAIFAGDDSDSPDQSFEEDYLHLELPALMKAPSRPLKAAELRPAEDGELAEAFASPAAGFEVRVTRAAIAVSSCGKLVAKVPLANPRVVIEHWATGRREMERLRAEAVRALKPGR